MIFKCAAHAPSTGAGGGGAVSRSGKTLTVDIHCHCNCADVAATMQAEADRIGRAALAYGSTLTQEVNRKQLAAIAPKMDSVDERLADMDRMGIDVQALSVPPYQFYYWAEPETGRDAAQRLNEFLVETVAKAPERFVALGTVPLQDPGMAVAELERCMKDLGMRGVEILTHVEGTELSRAGLDPFFARAEELGALIFIHPDGFTHGARFQEHYFLNLVGHPVENTLAIGHLVFDGVLDRYPGLKVCIAHGGGYVPAYAGRFDHGWHARADCRQHISRPPSEYMKQLYYDSVVFEPDQLKFLIRKYGADHILLGTDYPFDMGEDDPVGLIARVEGLSDDDRAAVGGMNAARLLKIGV
ncbi:MAG: amidohydrolase [Alphaproteobacteria bacterium]|nr:amidohydrolase [Alphaproteobacteria bacterium]